MVKRDAHRVQGGSNVWSKVLETVVGSIFFVRAKLRDKSFADGLTINRSHFGRHAASHFVTTSAMPIARPRVGMLTNVDLHKTSIANKTNQYVRALARIRWLRILG